MILFVMPITIRDFKRRGGVPSTRSGLITQIVPYTVIQVSPLPFSQSAQ